MALSTWIQRHQRSATLAAFVFFACVAPALLAVAELGVDLTMRLDRHAFYRGEEIAALVTSTNRRGAELSSLTLKADIDGLIKADLTIDSLAQGASFSQTVRLPTSKLRAQDYKCDFTLVSGTRIVTSVRDEIAQACRLNSERMPAWLWPHKSHLVQLAPLTEASETTLAWWADHGMTDLVVGESLSDDMIKSLDFSLALGLNANIMPNGGLTGGTAFAVEPAESGVWYRRLGEPGRAEHKLLTPFHPTVIVWQEAENGRFMSRVSNYPHIRSAFFNSEIVDQPTANADEKGRQNFGRELGFEPEELREPMFVQPCVVADDDRQLRLITAERRKTVLADGDARFDVDLTEIGGTVVALYSKSIAEFVVSAAKSTSVGGISHLSAQLPDTEGAAMNAIQPFRVTILDADGSEQESSGYYNLMNGMATVAFSPAFNDSTGERKLVVDELTAGLQEIRSIQVVESTADNSQVRSAMRQPDLIKKSI